LGTPTYEGCRASDIICMSQSYVSHGFYHNHENVISDDNSKDNIIIEIDKGNSSIDNDDEDISTSFNDNILNYLTFERNHMKTQAVTFHRTCIILIPIR